MSLSNLSNLLSCILNNVAILSGSIEEKVRESIKTYIEKFEKEEKEKTDLLKDINYTNEMIESMVKTIYENYKNILKDGKLDSEDIPYFIEMVKTIFENIKIIDCFKQLNNKISKSSIFALCEMICRVMLFVFNCQGENLKLLDKLLSSSFKLIEFNFNVDVKSVEKLSKLCPCF